jgi:hypothetical protein
MHSDASAALHRNQGPGRSIVSRYIPAQSHAAEIDSRKCHGRRIEALAQARERPKPKVSNGELEKVLAKATWNYSSSFVFTVDLLLQLVAEAMLDADIGHLLGEDPEQRPDAIVRILIDKIGHEDFKECMEAAYERITENSRKEWAVFVKLMCENAAKTKGGSARDRSSQSMQHDQAKDRPKERTRETPFCLNKKTCDGKKHILKDCPSTSKEEAHQLFDQRRQALKVRRAKIKEAKAEKRR